MSDDTGIKWPDTTTANRPGFLPAPKNDGWRCPGCGKCHAPWMPHCNCHKKVEEGRMSDVTELAARLPIHCKSGLDLDVDRCFCDICRAADKLLELEAGLVSSEVELGAAKRKIDELEPTDTCPKYSIDAKSNVVLRSYFDALKDYVDGRPGQDK